MAYEADRVVVDLIGNTGGLDRPVEQSARQFTRNMSAIEASAVKAEGQIVRSSGQMANAQRNLGRQISDIGTQLAAGQSPFLILAQQAPQVADALADTGGRAARVASFFAGPWGAALLAAGSVLGTLIPKLFSLGSAHDSAKIAAQAQADAEKQLSDVLQGTTKAGETARVAALGLAQAHVYEARAALNAARAQLQLAKARAAADAQSAVGGRAANYGALGVAQRSEEQARRQEIDVQQAESDLRVAELRQRNLEAAAATARGVEAQREKTTADRASAAAARREAAARRRAEAAASREAREAERLSDQQRKGMAELLNGRVDLSQAEADLSSDTRLQDQVLREKIEADRQINQAEIKDREGISKSQRDELLSINDRIADLRLRKVNADEAQRYLEEQTALQRSELDIARDSASAEMDMADTRERRREIALRLLDLAIQQERLEQEAILASKKSTDAQKVIAQNRLDSIKQISALQRENIDRQYESPGRTYLREINSASSEMGDALDNVAVRGLDRLNDQLADAITGAKSLGDAFSDVSNQIINDLLRIAIQQTIIKPLAESLFGLGAVGLGGGSGLFGSLIGSIFGRASGGHVAAGSIHRVNESSGGVELLRMGPQGGEVIPLGQTRAVSANRPVIVNQHFTLDARQGITTPQLLQGVNALVDQKAGQARDQAVAISRGVIPKDMQKAQRYGR